MKKRVLPEPEPPTTSTFFIPGISRIFGPAGHHQPLRLGQNDVIFRLGVHKGSNIRLRAPAGAPVFHILPVLFGIFPFHIDHQANHCGANQPDQPVNRRAGHRSLKGQSKTICQPQQLCGSVNTGSQPHRLANLGKEPKEYKIRKVRALYFFRISVIFIAPALHAPLFFTGSRAIFLAISLNFDSWERRDGLFSRFTVFCVYFLKAASIASA